MYLVKEDTHVIYQSGTIKQEVYAEAGDMLIVFYALDDFKYKLVVAKSAQWAENIKLYEEAEQKRKEEWAAKHAEAEEAVSIGCCPPNTAADIS